MAYDQQHIAEVKKYRPPHWSFTDKVMAVMVILGFLATGLWLAFPTSRLIVPKTFVVEGKKAYLIRELPFGPQVARWRSEIVVHDAAVTNCTSGNWQISNYEENSKNLSSYDLQSWADPCLALGENYTISNTRQALVFGMLPLMPSTTITDIIVKVEK